MQMLSLGFILTPSGWCESEQSPHTKGCGSRRWNGCLQVQFSSDEAKALGAVCLPGGS